VLRRLLPAAALLVPLLVAAQTYPARSIQMIVPLSAGSAVDAIMRSVTQKMSENLGQQIVIENIPGASGIIGAEKLKNATADGYVIGGFNDGTVAILPGLKQGLPYDPLKDFAPVSLVAGIDWVLVVNPAVSAKNLNEFLAMVRAKPGQINFSSGGNGSPQQIAMELFKAAANVDLTHVPYRGATPAAMDVIGGQIPTMFTAVAVVVQQIKSGKLRALAVAGAKRSLLLPDVPTVAEAGVKDYEFSTWSPIIVPAATPKAVVDRLNASVVKALGDAGLRERLIAQGLVPMGTPPEVVTQWTRDGIAKMVALSKRTGIKIE
jgi:tripartite-type tricarboxylate transporter receptor subunit TctC